MKSLNELVAYAKARPNQLNYGSVGIGSSQHLGGVYFEQIIGAKMTHVPYRNIAQYTPDLMAGHGAARLPVAAERARRAPERRRQGDRGGE